MQVRDAEHAGSDQDTALALGFFDGVHLGHQRVLHATLQAAAREGLVPAVFTFRNHPRHVLRPDSGPTLLTTFDERLDLLREQGIQLVFCCDFTPRLAAVPAETFILDWLKERLRARFVAAGPNYRFGHRATGTPDLLMQAGLPVDVVPPLVLDGEVVSSTRIRNEVAAGRMEAAARLLSRPYFMTGTVQHGDARGAGLGAATANLPLPPLKQAPPLGVYAVRVRRADGTPSPGVANFGTRPTFDGGSVLLEVHLLDQTASLYGETLRVSFVEYLRPERKFESTEALRAQIQADVERARRILATPVR